MRRRTRGQHDGAVALLRKLRRELARGLAVEADRPEFRAQVAQPVKIIGGRLANGRIEAAFTLACAEHCACKLLTTSTRQRACGSLPQASDPGEHLYEPTTRGGLMAVTGNKCEGDPADEAMHAPSDEVPLPILKQLARDLAARLVRAVGGPDKLRAEIKNQRIDFNQLSPELQEAFKPYFGRE